MQSSPAQESQHVRSPSSYQIKHKKGPAALASHRAGPNNSHQARHRDHSTLRLIHGERYRRSDRPFKTLHDGASTPVQPSTSHGGATEAVTGPSAGFRQRIIQLGIEAEFEIAICNIDFHRSNSLEFVKFLAANYNQEVPTEHPRMAPTMRDLSGRDEFDRWALTTDHTVKKQMISPYGLELVSPIFKAFSGSKWRQDVEAMWKYLHQYYNVRGTRTCSTHVHVSMDPAFSFQEIKRIAQAVIHFEPAFEVLVPPERRQNQYARSNWLDSPCLGMDNMSRLESMQAIEKTHNERNLLFLLQLFDDKYYSWNFTSLWIKRTIEFRKPPFSITAEDALRWAELAISFIQTAIHCDSIEQLRKVPPNIGGLRWFVSQFNELGVNEPSRLESLWQGKHLKAMLQPRFLDETIPGIYRNPRLKLQLRQLAEEDMKSNRMLARRAQEPYW